MEFYRSLHLIEILNLCDYHPPIDGKIEAINERLRNILRCIIGEKAKKWDLALPQEIFSYNNFFNKSTRKLHF